MILDYRKKVYDLLKTIEGVEVYQSRPEIIDTIPSITFRVEEYSPNYHLNRDIALDNWQIRIDIWHTNFTNAHALLEDIERLLIENNLKLNACRDIEDPDNVAHITCNFIY